MIPAFLRLFRLFREAEALNVELRVAADARMELQGEVRTLREQLDRNRELLDEALHSERECYQMLINFEFQIRHGVAPFPRAPRLPEKMARHDNGGPVDSAYTNMRSVQAAVAQENRAEIEEALGVKRRDRINA